MQEQTAEPLVTRELLEQQLAQNRSELQEVREQELVLSDRREYLEKQIEACKAGMEGFGWGYNFALAELEAAKQLRAALRAKRAEEQTD